MKIKHAALGLMIAATPALAAQDGAHFNYAAYVAGFNVLNLEAAIDLKQATYDIGMHVQTAGTMSTFIKGDTRTRVLGTFNGPAVQPTSYQSNGLWRGEQHVVDIIYQNRVPDVRTLLPSNIDDKREPVPADATRNTVDTVSAIALLMHNLTTTGKCETSTTTYDGRRLSEITVSTVGWERLPTNSRSSYAGPSVHCEMTGHQIAGYPRDAGPGDFARKPQTASAWLAQLSPGAPFVPVLMQFPTKMLGTMTVYLTDRTE